MKDKKETCIRCKNCTGVIKSQAENKRYELMDLSIFESLKTKGHLVTVEDPTTALKCKGKKCYEREGIQQLTLELI